MPTCLFATFLPALTRGRPPLERARITFAVLTNGARWGDDFTVTACELDRATARRLHLPEGVQLALFHVYDMWRGRGRPEELHGNDIPVASRIARLTGIAVLFESIPGVDAAAHAVRRRAGGMLDPYLAGGFADAASVLLSGLEDRDVRSVVLAEEPHPQVTLPDLRLAAEVFADLADLKSPYLLGHSRNVAELSGRAAELLGLPKPVRHDVEVAGLLHDIGRVAVSNAVRDKPGELTADEWEQVRLHPYHSERILAGSPELARIAPLVTRHHERLDGSGWTRLLAACSTRRFEGGSTPKRSRRS